MSYNGGKGGAGVYQQIINQIPPHRVYIEAFLGAGAVLKAKRPAEVTIGIEQDETVIAAHWQPAPHGVIVMCDDAIPFLRRYDWRGDEFVYCDPPYLMETRSTQRTLYGAEFADPDQHRALIEALRSLPCPVALSGYWSSLYELLLPDWRVITFNAMTRGGRLATEYLWLNYPPPLELHDYRYLGRTFRERERIKRKRERWKTRLRRMPDLERHALVSALAEVRAESCSTTKADDGCRRASPDLASLASIAETGADRSH